MSNYRIRSLARQYQHLFPEDPRFPLRMFGFEVGDGWHDFIKELLEDLTEIGFEGPIHQVKEKFGTLRFYAIYKNKAEHLLIDNAERMSGMVCESCGLKHIDYADIHGWKGYKRPWGRDPGKGHYVRGADEGRSWVKTLCNYCHLSEI